MIRAKLPARFFHFLRLGLFTLLTLADAHAHDPLEITTIARLRPETIEFEITMARSTALAVATGNTEAPTFRPENFEKHRLDFETCAPGIYTLTADGVPLAMRSVRLALGREQDVDFFIVYPRPAGGTLRLTARHISRLAYGYGAMLTVQAESGAVLGTKLLMSDDTVLEVQLPAMGTAPVAAPGAAGLFLPFLHLGIEHILTGYDHLLFLCGLLIACRRAKSMVIIVTCFTLAHSITLALAALNVMNVPSTIVEPLIAASIVFVGVENLLRREEPKGRWLLTFGFGLIHGFGFAGALRAAGLGSAGSALAVPLFSFNLGVELGQLAVIGVLLPVYLKTRDRPAFTRIVRPVISLLVALAGLWWLLQRTLLS